MYKNPDNVAADFAKELGIKEVDVFLIKATSDLDKLKDLAKPNPAKTTSFTNF